MTVSTLQKRPRKTKGRAGPVRSISRGAEAPIPAEQKVINALCDAGHLTSEDVVRIQRLAESTAQGALINGLIRSELIAHQDLVDACQRVLGVEAVNESCFDNLMPTSDRVTERFMKDRLILVSEADGKTQAIMSNPCDEYACHALTVALDGDFEIKIASADIIRATLSAAFSEAAQATKAKNNRTKDAVTDEDVERLKDLASEQPVVRYVNHLIQRAVQANASDIHIEPFDGEVKVRVRVDGVLQAAEAPENSMQAAVVSRIKLMAKLDIAERRLPQDGRIQVRIQGRSLDIRVASSPTLYGESLVLRLLNRGDLASDITALGYSRKALARLEEAKRLPNGLVIVTGPTGSGKTTSLYSILNGLNNVGRKIITVEDPVEYYLEGINQIQVKPNIGLTFANTLRSVVRQDPDVIMVGEIRDAETASICVESALTGHLVFSTLHTNDAASSVVRLLEMGVEDYLLSSTLSTVVAQRLVRTLCTECRIQRITAKADKEMVSDLLGARIDLPEHTFDAAGCEACGHTGFKGRTAVAEVLQVDTALAQAMRGGADAEAIKALAIQQGMRTMWEDGLEKVFAGTTTLSELLRNVRVD